MQRMHRAGALHLARQLRATTVNGPSPWESLLRRAVRLMIVICNVYALYWVVQSLAASPPDWMTAANLLLLLLAAWICTGLIWLGGDM